MRPGKENERAQHLDDDAFAKLSVGGALDAERQQHLASCASCREELVRFTGAVESFSLASLAWSERKSEALPGLRPAAKPKESGWNVRLAPVLSCVAVLSLLVLGVTVPVQKMHFTTLHDGDRAVVESDDAAGLNSPEQIAKDNQLMADVNDELLRSQAVLLSQYDRQRGGRADFAGAETGRGSR